MDNNILMFCIMCISSSQNILTTLFPYAIFILATLFKIKLYRFTNEETTNHICNNIKKDLCGCYTEQGDPFGVIIHKNIIPRYICWTTDHDYDKVITVVCSEKMKKKLTSKPVKEILDLKKNKEISEKSQENPEEDPTIDYYNRVGSYDYFFYITREITIDKTYSKSQQDVATKIISMYEKQNFLTVYIHGKTGTGKTMLAYLMAKQLGCSICDTFNPTDPGDLFSSFYSKINPSVNKPIIVLMDEIDVHLKKIHNQSLVRHKKVPIQVHDKSTWNSFFDKIDMGLYPYVIMILCSNKTKRELDRLDESYLRKGRAHLSFELEDDVSQSFFKID